MGKRELEARLKLGATQLQLATDLTVVLLVI